jgi:NitT/TauT family transport system substrate-binding protein
VVPSPGHGFPRLAPLLAPLALWACTAVVSPAPAASDTALLSPGGEALASLQVALTEAHGGNAVLWVAEAAGVFRQHRLDVALERRSMAAALRALANGELAVVVGSGAAALIAAATGTEVRLVAGLVNQSPYRFMVDPSIEGTADLRGARLGSGAPGSTTDLATRFVLRELRLEPGKDVTLLQIGSAAERLAALANGAIQGAVVAPPDTAALERLGFLTLLDLTALGVDDPHYQVIVSAALSAEQPAVVQRFVYALIEATALAKRDRGLTKQVLREHLPSADEPALDETYELFVQRLAPQVPYPAAKGMQHVLPVLLESEPRVSAVDPALLLDPSFVQRAVDTGLVARLYGGR